VAPDAALTVRVRQADGSWTPAPFTRNGDQVQIAAGGLRAYRLTVPGSPVDPAVPLPGAVYFAQTRHNLGGGFLDYWRAHGGLPPFGYPISEELAEVSPTDGKTYTVQYFERARFEYHPEYAGTPHEVLLGLLGVSVLRDKGWIP